VTTAWASSTPGGRRTDVVAGRGKALFDTPRISSRYHAGPGRVSVDVDSRQMGDFPAMRLEVILQTAAGERLNQVTVSPFRRRWRARYMCRSRTSRPRVRRARPRPGTAARRWAGGDGQGDCRERPAWTGKVRILNNLVWSCSACRAGDRCGDECTFVNPHQGWVFVASVTEVELRDNNRVEIRLGPDPRSEPLIVHAAGRDRTQEAMRFLPQASTAWLSRRRGSRPLRVSSSAPSGTHLRRVPAETQRHQDFPPRDLAFMERSGLCGT